MQFVLGKSVFSATIIEFLLKDYPQQSALKKRSQEVNLPIDNNVFLDYNRPFKNTDCKLHLTYCS